MVDDLIYEEEQDLFIKSLTQEQYDSLMQKVWSGASSDITAKFNDQLLARAKNKLYRDSDTRSFVKFVLSQAKCVKPKEYQDKVYQEAVKRSLSKEEYWAVPVRGFKGTRLQWYQYQQQEKDLETRRKSGQPIHELRRYNTILDVRKPEVSEKCLIEA